MDIELIVRYRARCIFSDAEPDTELTQSQTQNLDQTTAQKLRLVKEVEPLREPRYQHVTVTKSKQSNVVKLEPAAGPTLFLNSTMTTDRSTTITAIRIQYCQHI